MQLVEFVYSFEETALKKFDAIKPLEKIMDINFMFLSHIVAKSSRILGLGSFMTLILIPTMYNTQRNLQA
jgi:hypothetical protein